MRVTTEDGVSADAVLTVAVAPLVAQLVTDVSPVYAGMVRGQQTIVDFKIINRGGAATGPINVTLPVLPWLKLASTAPLPALEPGETNTITLLLSPASDLELTTYDGSLLVNAGNSGVNVPV